MRLARLRLWNFWSFGGQPAEIDFESLTFLLGPNGAGKTAVLQALARMFSHDPAQRNIRRSDFHVPLDEDPDAPTPLRELWVEADFEFPELAQPDADKKLLTTVPSNFAHMRLQEKSGPTQVRFRLKATMDDEGDIEESLTYVVNADEHGKPVEENSVVKHERRSIQVAYLPAQRDPADHISYSANAMLGRALRAANWSAERDKVSALTQQISDSLVGNKAMKDIAEALATQWGDVHKSEYYSDPSVSFTGNEMESLLRHLTVGFSPGHEASRVDFSRLSDGQQSLLYLSLVLAMQDIGRKVLNGELGSAFDVDKLRPPVFTLIAVEEPENSLSPHSLGRVTRALAQYAGCDDAQAVVATHSASVMRRVNPEAVRYLRLNGQRHTLVKHIPLPTDDAAAHKFVREAVQAYPELYFARFVVLGEGDSEEVVLGRLLEARGMIPDDVSISVVPLGGRHVNHFWRLLTALGIPHVTLLDLDLVRFGGGWGRMRYAAQQLLSYVGTSQDQITQDSVDGMPAWDGEPRLRDDDQGWISRLESFRVFFATPLDLDFLMLSAFPAAYEVKPDELELPDETSIVSVLGKSHGLASQYSDTELKYFDAYHSRFKLGSKPTWHLRAMGSLDNQALSVGMPEPLKRLFAMITASLPSLPQ